MIRVRILTGGNAGRVHAFQRGPVTAGRHPACDLRFAAHADLEVSARHAVLEHRSTLDHRHINWYHVHDRHHGDVADHDCAAG